MLLSCSNSHYCVVYPPPLSENLREVASLLIETAFDYIDQPIKEHSENVANLSVSISAELGLTDDQINIVWAAGMLHDIGKSKIPREILNNPHHLSYNERWIISQHSEEGYNLLKTAPCFLGSIIPEVVLQYHERLDGSGYPWHLKGSQILQESLIVSLADSVVAMSECRVYRPALNQDAIIREVTQKSGSLYDPNVVEAYLRFLDKSAYQLNSISHRQALH